LSGLVAGRARQTWTATLSASAEPPQQQEWDGGRRIGRERWDPPYGFILELEKVILELGIFNFLHAIWVETLLSHLQELGSLHLAWA